MGQAVDALVHALQLDGPQAAGFQEGQALGLGADKPPEVADLVGVDGIFGGQPGVHGCPGQGDADDDFPGELPPAIVGEHGSHAGVLVLFRGCKAGSVSFLCREGWRGFEDEQAPPDRSGWPTLRRAAGSSP